jgi:hypothetical protein
MALYPIPHSDEWFRALREFNPHQAYATKTIIELAGSKDVCSTCGDAQAKDYKLVGEKMAKKAIATIRLCDDCIQIRRAQYGEKFAEFKPEEKRETRRSD